MKKFSTYQIILLVILVLGAVLRFYNLDWGDGHFFHPDERNIGMAVANINPKNGDFNPNFFAYGSFPIYMIYFFSKGNFELSLLTGRFLSAVFSTISLALIYLITKQLLVAMIAKGRLSLSNTQSIEKYAILAVAISAFSPGLIQFAHFTTFESFLTFEYLLFVYFGAKLIYKPSWTTYLLLGVVTGLAIGTKIVSLFLLAIFILIHLIVVLGRRSIVQNNKRFIIELPFKLLSPQFILSTLLIGIVFVATNPFMFLDYEAFRGSLAYESSVARGTMIVFYTQQFLETIPFVYQFFYVFPSLLSWPLTVLGILSIVFLTMYCTIHGIIFLFKDRGKVKLPLIVFTLTGMGYTLFHLTMFVKWSRYMQPATPFLIIATVLVLANFSLKSQKIFRYGAKSLLYFTAIVAIAQGVNFFTIYLKPDPRIEASQWLADNSGDEDKFAGEVYDMGMTAFNEKLGTHNITEFDYYHIDDEYDNEDKLSKLATLLEESDYIIVPAERIYPTRARLPQRFPNGYNHYRKLFSEELGFREVAQFTRTTYLEDILGIRFYSGGIFAPLNYDETFLVFDQPTINIFRKTE